MRLRDRLEQGRPGRLARGAQELEARLAQRLVRLLRVAAHAREHAVLPRRLAAARAGQDVVDRQLVGRAAAAAVLAGVAVAAVEVAPAERDLAPRDPRVAAEEDDLGLLEVRFRRVAGQLPLPSPE